LVVSVVISPARVFAADTETVLYNFCSQAGCADGTLPVAGLVADSSGDLYGTTDAGGTSNDGVVFKLTPSGTETVLHSFAGGTDGDTSYASLIMGKKGTLYGTTYAGGSHSAGTVFEVTSAGTETILHAFDGGSSDGAQPFAGLTRDVKGNLYGVTTAGGTNGHGVVFKLAPDGTETVLHSFAGGSGDGAEPIGGLILDKKMDLYGTTYEGGAGKCGNGCGTVFRVSHKGKEDVLYSFQGGADGLNPQGTLLMDRSGNLFGTSSNGGANSDGTVFESSTSGSEELLLSFDGYDGEFPTGALTADSQLDLYGTTHAGGTDEQGAVFEMTTRGRPYFIPSALSTVARTASRPPAA
jgi:uncharacterized repeat protein (TIGR03803 family)